jgi:hypothetical protein
MDRRKLLSLAVIAGLLGAILTASGARTVLVNHYCLANPHGRGC